MLEKNEQEPNAMPEVELRRLASSGDVKLDVLSHQFAKFMDERDELASFRKKFVIPRYNSSKQGNADECEEDTEEVLYFCGHSLGLRPKKNTEYLDTILDQWDSVAVDMHFEGNFPAASCEEKLKPFLTELTGAEEDEVAALNALTVNLNILSLTFYKPTESRHKILIEHQAFPSDRYAMQSLLKYHGYDPEVDLIELQPRQDEEILRDEDIIETIERRGSEIAMILFPGVQYYTGQLFDMKRITEVGQQQGCIVGLDLAHAIGNTTLSLHDWNVDFAVWCTYKYLCSGPGGLGGAFLHRKWKHITPALSGWWGNKFDTRFDMKRVSDASIGADAFKMSNTSPFLVTMSYAGLEIYHEAGMDRFLKKQFLLTGYLEMLLIHQMNNQYVDKTQMNGNHEGNLLKIITPSDPQRRGSQLSVSFAHPMEHVLEELSKQGVQVDFRQPNVIRVGAQPLYNSFMDVFNFVRKLKTVLNNIEI